MAGQIKRMLDAIVAQRSKGNPLLIETTTTKLVLKGVDPTRYTLASADDPALIAKVKAIATDLGVTL